MRKQIFLTSDIGSYKKINGENVVCAFSNENGLVNQIRSKLDGRDVFVFIASDPNGFERTDSYAEILFKSFLLAGFSFSKCVVIDNRNKENLKELISSAGIVYLAGGHLPTQNDFIHSIGLKSLLAVYDGIILGQSAGSMNLARIVYNYPEDLTELNDPKFLQGLELTELSIVPHFNLQNGNEQVEDGIDLMNDYLLKDSFKVPLYCLTNGSHIYVSEDKIQVFGDAYLIRDGKISKLNRDVSLERNI